MTAAAYPLLFVFLWSTGFIGAKFGLPHTEPLSFYLTPPTKALIAWVVFGEKLTLTAGIGMAAALGGVYLVARPAK